jgi:ankyrin repeat protein
MTYAIILIADKLLGANIDVQTELEGLDMMEIGEVAYGIERDNEDEDLGHILCAHAAKGELIEIKRFHRLHNRLDQTDYDERSALHIAAAAGHMNVVEFLIKKKVDVNSLDKY